MEEIRQIALAYYANLPPNQKNEIIKLFRDMDGDGNGSITFAEYMAFFNFKGEEMTAIAARIFKEFDIDGNGTLDFEEVICFFYAHGTRRMVFCDGPHLGADFYDNYALLRSGITSSPPEPIAYSPARTTSSSKGHKAKEVVVPILPVADAVFKGVHIAHIAKGAAAAGLCSIM